MNKRRLIVVLGMHRSGSSAVTKGLEVLGVDLGTKLMEPDASNAKGYFEDIELNQLNDKILRTCGYDWTSLSLINAKEFQSDKFSNLHREAIDTLKSKLSGTQILGVKDPRFCRLLAFWKPVFSELALDVSYLIILRNPESIAASLLARDSFPRVKSLYLWLEHVIPAFQESMGLKRSVVEYEKLVANPKHVIQTIANELDLHKSLNKNALLSYQAEFIDSSLMHHNQKQISTNEFTPRLIRRLYELIDQVSKQSISTDSVEFMNEINLIASEHEDRKDILAYIDTLDSIIIRENSKIVQKEAQLAEQVNSNEDLEASLLAAIKANNVCDLEIANLKTSLGEKAGQITVLNKSLEEKSTDIKRLVQSFSDQESKAKLLKLILSEQKQKALALKNQINDLSARLNSRNTDVGKLLAQKNLLHSSLFWKLSKLSRSFWSFFESAFTAKKEIFILDPQNDIQTIGALSHKWRSIGCDPYFFLVPITGALPKGWVRVQTCLKTEPKNSSLKIYLDLGKGFSENNTLEIPVTAFGKVDEIIYLPNNLKAIRWDPMETEGKFTQESIAFTSTSWLPRKTLMLKRVLSVRSSRSRDIVAKSGLDKLSSLKNLNQAYEVSRIILTSNECQKQLGEKITTSKT